MAEESNEGQLSTLGFLLLLFLRLLVAGRLNVRKGAFTFLSLYCLLSIQKLLDVLGLTS